MLYDKNILGLFQLSVEASSRLHIMFGVFVLVLCFVVLAAATKPPHIVFIVVDDLGWNDVGWHNEDIKTPNLDKLARKGVILNSSYVQPMCTPSRGAFMTGYYPYHLGLQAGAFQITRPQFLPPNITTLPEKLKELGYSTHIVGKWHLGFCNWTYTPTHRGFDTYFGHYGGADHYTRMKKGGYDLRFNEDLYYTEEGAYSTHIFARRAVEIISTSNPSKPLFLYLPFLAVHKPLKVPKKYEEMYKAVKKRGRRVYSGMVTAIDEAIGNITDALDKHRYMDNLLLVFTTDDEQFRKRPQPSLSLTLDADEVPAALHPKKKYPWRLFEDAGCIWSVAMTAIGYQWQKIACIAYEMVETQMQALTTGLFGDEKKTLWEGGTRGVAFVYSKTLLENSSYVNSGLIHAVDWLPTFVHIADGRPDTGIDGFNMWPVLSRNQSSPRREFVYNINEKTGNSAIRVADYKLIEGDPGDSAWFDPSGKKVKAKNTNTKSTRKVTRRRKGKQNMKKYLLFNIRDDPTETTDISSLEKKIRKKLIRRLNFYKRSLVPAFLPPSSENSDPSLYNGTWSPGWC